MGPCEAHGLSSKLTVRNLKDSRVEILPGGFTKSGSGFRVPILAVPVMGGGGSVFIGGPLLHGNYHIA